MADALASVRAVPAAFCRFYMHQNSSQLLLFLDLNVCMKKLHEGSCFMLGISYHHCINHSFIDFVPRVRRMHACASHSVQRKNISFEKDSVFGVCRLLLGKEGPVTGIIKLHSKN